MNNTEETLDFEQKHKEDLQRLRGFRLLDDDFMSKVFEDKACAEFLLQIILQRHDLKVQSVQGQYDIKNLQGRSIRLDILAVDSNNRIYNIEIQRSDRGADAKRETNTMPQWAGSSWYFLRYVDSHNDKELVSKEKADKYLPVDMYIGGVEHAVLHLLYSRFYTKFLYDIGVIDFDEPFHKLFNQGMITGKNGIKMSKSKGNVISPDDLVRDYGCDSLRMYELFVGPPELDAEWDDRGIEGVYRFLSRFWNLVMDNKDKNIKASKEMIKARHKMIHMITTRLEGFSLNTVISGFMECNNNLIAIAKKEGGMDKETLEAAVLLLAPFAPHMGEELWEELGHTDSVFHHEWPAHDEEAMKDDEVEIPVQVNGKTKAVISIPVDISKEDAIAKAKEVLGDKLSGNIIKEIYVPKKIVNIVAK